MLGVGLRRSRPRGWFAVAIAVLACACASTEPGAGSTSADLDAGTTADAAVEVCGPSKPCPAGHVCSRRCVGGISDRQYEAICLAVSEGQFVCEDVACQPGTACVSLEVTYGCPSHTCIAVPEGCQRCDCDWSGNNPCPIGGPLLCDVDEEGHVRLTCIG